MVVDNTNPSPEEWTPLIEVARRHGARVSGYWFPPDLERSQERNALRSVKTRVPDVGLYATLKRLRRPSAEDGFDELYTVGLDDEGGFVVERG
ncbi:AAA family ATPase [Amycolatopsis keratiniphila]|uniref:Putative kinase n=1 Tax=Amycolatopsis keratiniphila TaxID=129921 RepID=R4TD80_9PSEU|nr:AAA family ATPase [Amycolatopsis keratiniphila]AGM10191.1 putative kinase [Amycolatopsis keratiniphila]